MCMIGKQMKSFEVKRSLNAYKVFLREGKAYRPLFHMNGIYNYEGNKVEANHKPTLVNTNGWWAFKTHEDAKTYAKEERLIGWIKPIVRRVRISGKVVEHAAGYRSEFMKIMPREKS